MSSLGEMNLELVHLSLLKVTGVGTNLHLAFCEDFQLHKHLVVLSSLGEAKNYP